MTWLAETNMSDLLRDLLTISAVILAGVGILWGSLAVAGWIAKDAKDAWRKAMELSRRIREHDGGRE